MRKFSPKQWLAALVMAGLLGAPALVSAQSTGQVTGTVTGDAGQPLAGANVLVAGTARGAQTGADGRFTISAVPAGSHTVRASFAGHSEATMPVTVSAGQTATVNLRLSSAVVQLEGVVAVGYGTQRKVNVTGAVDAIEGETLTQRPVPNVSQALQGVAPGVTVIQRGGAPGRDAANIKIRGIGTIGNDDRSNALLVVDGVAQGDFGAINNIAPADIESISVLKDAASAAIYGSRAANGVVLVTTRRGNRAGSMSISYDGSYGIQGVTDLPPRVGMEDYIRLINEGYVNAGLRPRYSEEYIQNTIRSERGELKGDSALMYPHTDWVDVIYNPAPIQDHALRISGGNQLAAYSLSVNAMEQDGMITNTAADRYSVRLNTDINLSSRFTGGVDFNLRRQSDTEPFRMGDLLFYLFHDTPPMVQAKYPDGSYGMSDTNRNSLADAEQSGLTERTTWYGALSAKADYRIMEGLTVRTLASAQRSDFTSRGFRAEYVFYDYWDKSRVLKNSWTPNRLTIQRDDRYEVNLRGLLDYERVFGDHDVHAILGYDEIANDRAQIQAQRDGFYNNEVQEINAGDVALDDASGFSQAWRLRSAFGRFNYNYLGKYLLEANARYDGSSRFAEGNRFGFFPSFSVGWRLSEESFFADNVGFIDDLKLRGSWGKLGNQDVGLYAFYSTVNMGLNQAFGTALQRGAATTGLANRDITWETTEMIDLGVDLSVLDGRLSFTGDVYDKNTTGILLTLPIPAVIGRGAPVQNAGEISNRGWEASATWRDVIGEELDYSIGFNLSDNQNKVVSLVGTGPYIRGGSNNQTVDMEGHPIGSFFGYKSDGLYQTAEEVANGPVPLNPGVGPGDVRYVDINGDGQITTDDRTIIGNPNPRYTFSTNLSAGWNGFDASVFLQGVGKVDALVNLGLAEGPNWENYTTTWHLDRWSPENRDARVPRPLYHSTWNTIHSDYWIQNGRYMKVKNAQLGYSLPRSMIDRIGVDRLRVYVTGQNLFTMSALELELDPEFRNGNGAQYPQARTVSFGTNLSF